MKPALLLLAAVALLASFLEADRQRHPQLAISNAEAAKAEPNPFPVTTSFGGMPPERFKQEVLVPVGFLYIDNLGEVCGVAEPPKTRLGCATEKAIAIIHPCAPLFKGEMFAKFMCHEIAHANGWPAEHGP